MIGTAIVAVINIMPAMGSETEDQEVSQSPHRALDDGQDQKRNRRGTSQAVNDADDDRPYRSIPFHATEDAI